MGGYKWIAVTEERMELVSYLGLEGRKVRDDLISDLVLRYHRGEPLLEKQVHDPEIHDQINHQFNVCNQVWKILKTYKYHPNPAFPLDKKELQKMVVVVATNTTLNWTLRSVVSAPELSTVDQFVIQAQLNRNKHHNAMFYLSIGIGSGYKLFVNHRKQTYHVQILYRLPSGVGGTDPIARYLRVGTGAVPRINTQTYNFGSYGVSDLYV